jgi:histidinol-phosphate aminotransferase
MMKPLKDIVRPNILALAPYSSARNEYSCINNAHVFLDANENPYNSPLNRYPDPLQLEVKAKLAPIKGVSAEQICLGNGSDETIDLMYRCFARPGVDNVVAIEPTYGMYKVCADINDIEYRPVDLDADFQTTAEKLLSACDKHTKFIWICSPNNPSGNNIQKAEVEKVLNQFDGLVVVDEAYSDFSAQAPFRLELSKHPNLVVLNTFSKAWGCAAIRLGIAMASKEIIDIFNKVKYPYNVNALTQRQALEALKDPFEVDRWVKILIDERDRVINAFKLLPFCQHVYPTDANFFLTRMNNAQEIYDYLVERGIIVRNRSRIHLCNDCLRITIGSKNENNELLSALRSYN